MPKIPALPPMTSPDGADELPIEDVSTSTTKYITLTRLKEWLQSIAGFVTTAMIGDSQVTGAKIASYRTSRQNDTTNTTETGALVQTGWGRITMPGGSAYTMEDVVFPVAYTNIPIVILTPGGDRTAAQGAGVYGQGGNNVHGQIYGGALQPSTTGFKAKVGTSAGGGSYSAGDTVYYQWIAIGT